MIPQLITGNIQFMRCSIEILKPLYIAQKTLFVITFQNTAIHAKNYLDLLEVEYKENPDARNLYNYARELYIYENYEQALEVFKEYQKITKNVNEQAHAYLLMGHCEFFYGE